LLNLAQSLDASGFSNREFLWTDRRLDVGLAPIQIRFSFPREGVQM